MFKIDEQALKNFQNQFSKNKQTFFSIQIESNYYSTCSVGHFLMHFFFIQAKIAAMKICAKKSS